MYFIAPSPFYFIKPVVHSIKHKKMKFFELLESSLNFLLPDRSARWLICNLFFSFTSLHLPSDAVNEMRDAFFHIWARGWDWRHNDEDTRHPLLREICLFENFQGYVYLLLLSSVTFAKRNGFLNIVFVLNRVMVEYFVPSHHSLF